MHVAELRASARRNEPASGGADGSGLHPAGDDPRGAPPRPPLLGKVAASSPAMRDVLVSLGRISPTDVTVTLVGETGAGKDVLARSVHAASARAQAPFVVFDCGSVAPTLVESELLGHERGAFTGAFSMHAGAFQRADGGTLFLDEIGELPLALQPRLLRALENRCIRRVGGKIDHPVNVRVIAATNRDLRAEVAAGRFREDLFFRLAVAVVEVPPLRTRLEDLPALVESILAHLGRPEVHVTDEGLAALRAHPWPGNVRELKNALACAIAFVEPGVTWLEPKHLRLFTPRTEDRADASDADSLPLAGHALARLERAAIHQTLLQNRGNKAHAARALGIAVSTLYEKLKRYGLG